MTQSDQQDITAPELDQSDVMQEAPDQASGQPDNGNEDSNSDVTQVTSEGEGPSTEKVSPLEEECDVAADYLEELLDIADLDGDLDTFTEGGRAHVSIVTDSDVLVGKDTVVLDALQELSRLAVMTETGRRSRLMLDIGGHRQRRRTELRELAADAVAEVKSSAEAVALSPMNPFERKIVHDAIADAGYRSESEGEEPKRHVVVLPPA